MCGIVGRISARGVHTGSIERMLAMVRHRGPDDSGTWLSDDRTVGLAQARLSIIDLSPAGHQPMLSSRSRCVISFNGEIYNFQALRDELQREGLSFRTGTDTEVILAAYERWGTGALSRLNGMFAFALYDGAAGKILVARDRIGKKPLHYFHDDHSLTFGSEAKAILASAPDRDWPLDSEAVQTYFAFGYMPGERSIFRGLRRLPPGHYLSYDIRRNSIAIEPYWSIESVLASRRPSRDREELLDELERLLDDSVRLRMIADVPLGVLLSGGIDSSLTTAMASRHASKVKTFTVTFPGAGVFDERDHARTVSQHFGTDHHELPLPSADFSVFREIAGHLDEPLADPSVIPTYLISKLTRQHVTVALGGDGGDELFGGYPWYRRALSAQDVTRYVPETIRRFLAAAVRAVPQGVPGRNYVLSRAGDLPHFLITSSLFFDRDLRRSLLRDRKALDFPEMWKRALWFETGDDVTAMSVLDLRAYLPDDILVKVDRASMAFALEMRAPFLDYRIIEFALQKVPSELKVTATGSRELQRELAARLLPPQLELNRKQGFVMPIHEWFSGSWGDEVAGLVTSPEVSEWIDPAVVAALLAGHRKGRTNGLRLFTIGMFALWLDGLREMRQATPKSSEIFVESTSSHAS